jgi:hypothetical protein
MRFPHPAARQVTHKPEDFADIESRAHSGTSPHEINERAALSRRRSRVRVPSFPLLEVS